MQGSCRCSHWVLAREVLEHVRVLHEILKMAETLPGSMLTVMNICALVVEVGVS